MVSFDREHDSEFPLAYISGLRRDLSLLAPEENAMKKIAIAAVVVILLLPVIPHLIPKEFTVEAFQAALQATDFVVTPPQRLDNPVVPGAVEGYSMNVNGAQVDVLRFDDEGKIATQLEYQKPDVGSAIVEASGLAESLGAAKPKNKPVLALRNGMYMALITHEDKTLRERIGKVFKGM
jgi:hypothetical protein